MDAERPGDCPVMEPGEPVGSEFARAQFIQYKEALFHSKASQAQKWDAEHPRSTSQNDNQVGMVYPAENPNPAPTEIDARDHALLNGPADRTVTIP